VSSSLFLPFQAIYLLSYTIIHKVMTQH
jgi:hypothetical protein